MPYGARWRGWLLSGKLCCPIGLPARYAPRWADTGGHDLLDINADFHAELEGQFAAGAVGYRVNCPALRSSLAAIFLSGRLWVVGGQLCSRGKAGL